MNKERTVRCDSAPGAAGTSGAAWNGPLFLLRAARQLWSPQARGGAEAGQGGRKQRAVGNQEPGLRICRRGKGDTQGTSPWGWAAPRGRKWGGNAGRELGGTTGELPPHFRSSGESTWAANAPASAVPRGPGQDTARISTGPTESSIRGPEAPLCLVGTRVEGGFLLARDARCGTDPWPRHEGIIG